MCKENTNQYTTETYHITHDLSFTLAYEKNVGKLPGNGGLRFQQYKDKKDQEEEAMVLAQNMTKKHMLYNTGFSGFKIVANGQINNANKEKLLQKIGDLLNGYSGKLYTGCDLNINDDDMLYLRKKTPYILNAIGTNINTSMATAYGVYGSLTAVMESSDKIPKKILIHGLGKVGSAFAKELINKNHEVYTFDKNASNANISGAINISNNENWYEHHCDYLLLCSGSGIIDESYAKKLNCQWIVSSSNSPFKNAETIDILDDRNIFWIPDVVSNAGAVICDSIEFCDSEKYKSLKPDAVYKFVFDRIYMKTKRLLDLSRTHHLKISELLNTFLTIQETTEVSQLFV